MELFDLLRKDESLKSYLRNECEDEGICVEFAPEIDRKEILIIKIDDYYNAQHLTETPNSIDCLIIQFCGENKYTLNLLELKNVKWIQSLNNKKERTKLRKKFHETLFDFMRNRFRQYFDNSNFLFKYNLFLCAGKVQNEYIKIHKLDFLMNIRPVNFYGKLLYIDGIPPHPTIKPCTK